MDNYHNDDGHGHDCDGEYDEDDGNDEDDDSDDFLTLNEREALAEIFLRSFLALVYEYEGNDWTNASQSKSKNQQCIIKNLTLGGRGPGTPRFLIIL